MQRNFFNNAEMLRDAFIPKAFSNVIDNLMTEAVNGNKEYNFRPRVDVLERENAYELQVLLPGMSKEDIKVQVEDRKLTISGERRRAQEEGVKYHSQESLYGNFSRSFNLPKRADTEQVEARFENGILYLTIGKSEIEKNSKVIDIK